MTPEERIARFDQFAQDELVTLRGEVRGLRAERDQLREARDTLRSKLAALPVMRADVAEAERDRYRAALEALASGKVAVTAETHRLVTEALRGTTT